MFRLFRDGCVVTLMSLREIVAPVPITEGNVVCYFGLGRKWDSRNVWKYFNFDGMYCGVVLIIFIVAK